MVARARAGAVAKAVDVHIPTQLARERNGHHAGGGAPLLHAVKVMGDRTHKRRRYKVVGDRAVAHAAKDLLQALVMAAPVEWRVAVNRIKRRARRARH
eukprot:scaffold42954_cov74-Phaeocystis_antarctica.AAC.13